MAHLAELNKRVQAMDSAEEMALKQWGMRFQDDGLSNMRHFDMMDTVRLLIYRRAVQSGYYSDRMEAA